MKRRWAFLAAWLAAWCQVVAVAAMPLGPLLLAADPLGSVPICHSDVNGDAGQPGPSLPAHTDHDCVLCAACQASASPIAVLSSAPLLTAAESCISVRIDVPQARAPPVRQARNAQPRAPPL